MRDRIGGDLDVAAMRVLHRAPNSCQLQDASDAVRRALAALRATDPALMSADTRAAVGRCAAALVDVGADLATIRRRIGGSR